MAEQVGHHRLAEKILDGGGKTGPAVVHHTGVRVATVCSPHQAATLAGRFKRADDASEGERLRRINQLEPPLRPTCRAQNARAGEGVKRLREVIAGGVKRRGDVIHPDRAAGAMLGDIEDGAKRALGRAVQPHRERTGTGNLANIMSI